MNSFDKLQSLNTQIVADTGDIDLIKKYKPVDVTTNPSLILKVSKDVRFTNLIKSNDLEKVLVSFGTEISKEITGYISTEVNPEFSWNTNETINIARKIINLYKENGIDKNRILIKIAATWEGIEAARVLEKEGIKCNMTLIFSITQALACAQAKVTLISPFVGRITDYYKKEGHIINSVEEDPGVKSVKDIYKLFKIFNFKTIIMGASFRNIDQIKSLAGVDKLTISPNLIEELINDYDLELITSISQVNKSNFSTNLIKDNYNKEINSDIFEESLINNKMSKIKLEEGINKFIEDTNELKELLTKKME
jgi:transaldolase